MRAVLLRRNLLPVLALAALVMLSPAMAGADSLTVRYAGEMTRLPVGSDAVALGEVTGVVLPRHASSSFWNPASAAFMRHYEVTGEGAELYDNLSRQACAAVAVPITGGLGITALYAPLFSGPIAQYDTLKGIYKDRLQNEALRADGSSLGEFLNNQHLVIVSVGKLLALTMPRPAQGGFPLPLDIGAGCSFKTGWQTMNPAGVTRMSMNVNLDAGITARVGLDYDLHRKNVSREVLVAAAIRDFLPSPVVWIGSRDEYNVGEVYREFIEPSYYCGCSYVDRSGILWARWTLLAAVVKQYKITYHYGIESEFWNIIAFRAGLSDRVPTLGAGIRYRKLFLDYSFKFDDLAYSYVRLTVGVGL
jgi:hypothetical protein